MPDEITYSSVINACAKGDESQRALNLLDEMRSRGLVPDEITYNSVINACAKGGESQRALNLLDEMRRYGLVPDVDHVQQRHQRVRQGRRVATRARSAR